MMKKNKSKASNGATTNGSSPTTNKDVHNSDDGIEMFISHGSHKPVIIPPLSSSRKKARSRWKLLKNVARFTSRRGSLTQAEEDLLQVLETDSTNKASNKTAKEKKQQEERRRQLRQSICSKGDALTVGEQEFLKSLVASNDVSVQQLRQVNSVLEADPLYADNSSVFFKKKKEPRPSISRPTLQQDGPSFRKEVWMDYEKQQQHKQQETSSEEEEQVPVFKKPEKKPSLVEKLFGITPDSEKLEEPVQQQPMDAAPIPNVILATHANDEDCYPHVLSPPIMDALRPHMPFAIQEDNFWLKYSMIRDGASMRVLLSHIRSSARTIIAIETFKGDVFGSFTSSPWRPQGHEYYGSGEAFMWRLSKSRYTPCNTPQEQIDLEAQIQVFPWTGENRNVQSLVSPESHLILGGGGSDNDSLVENRNDEEDKGVALCIDATLTRGTSEKSLTFKNPRLDQEDEGIFEIANIEVWTMTPVEDLRQAQQLELGRQFVFDHGNFVEQ